MNTPIAEREQIAKTALRYAVSKSPGFAALALWVPIHVEEGDFIACTNGRVIRIGPGFFRYAPLEQAGILVHEILHVALRHIPRARKGRFDPLLWNLCTDAVINHAIGQMPWLSVPKDAIEFGTLLRPKELGETPPHQWTSEALYAHLLKDCKRLEKLLSRFVGDLIVLSEGEGAPLEEDIWRERLMRAQAGDKPGGLLRVVGQDFPNNTVPWEKVLRRLVSQPLRKHVQPNWNRPSRRTLSLGGDFWEPGIRQREGLHTAGVVVDTSGSIDGELLTRFAAEIQAIQRQTGCDIYLICADADVQSEQLIRNDGASFRQKVAAGKIEFKGGGGTVFYPALQRMAEKKVRVCVYLTDLWGDFGEETRYSFPVIWASITKGESAPFGTTVYLE